MRFLFAAVVCVVSIDQTTWYHVDVLVYVPLEACVVPPPLMYIETVLPVSILGQKMVPVPEKSWAITALAELMDDLFSHSESVLILSLPLEVGVLLKYFDADQLATALYEFVGDAAQDSIIALTDVIRSTPCLKLSTQSK